MPTGLVLTEPDHTKKICLDISFHVNLITSDEKLNEVKE